jgi:lipooligosaccharide transport system permease protein
MADMPYLTFLASGIIASSAMTTATFEGMYSVFTRMVPQRTYEAILATPIEIDDILAGEMIWCATKSVFSGVAILIVATLLGVVADWRALWVIPTVFLIGLCFAGPAIMMSAFASNYDFFNYYFVLVATPMFILCGVFYPVSTLPEALQGFVQVLPLTHAVALTRPLIAGQPLSAPGLHTAVLAGYAAISYYFAVVLVRRRLLV